MRPSVFSLIRLARFLVERSRCPLPTDLRRAICRRLKRFVADASVPSTSEPVFVFGAVRHQIPFAGGERDVNYEPRLVAVSSIESRRR